MSRCIDINVNVDANATMTSMSLLTSTSMYINVNVHVDVGIDVSDVDIEVEVEVVAAILRRPFVGERGAMQPGGEENLRRLLESRGVIPEQCSEKSTGFNLKLMIIINY